MEKLKCQVGKDELKNPVCVKTIYKKNVGGEAKAKQIVEQSTGYLDKLGIRFAMEEKDSIIDIFVEVNSLED